MKLFHAADIHLGRKRLDGRLPDSDIADALRFIVGEAIRERADVFLLAGDLFDRPQVEPPHLRQAQIALAPLKAAGIPVIAIEGNHDRHFVHSNLPTWVNFLAEDDLLILLRPEFGPEGARLEPWNKSSRRGAFVDIGGIRFIGAGYLGAATPNKIRQILAALDGPLPHVLLLHAGPEYFVGEGGGFSTDDLEALQRKICYLALGHIHKPMLRGNWACNPGSPENCDLREAAYGRAKNGSNAARGYAVVEIDPLNAARPVLVEIRSNPRRPVHRLEMDCTPLGTNSSGGAEAFIAAAITAIRHVKPEPAAIVELALVGSLNLDRIALDPIIASEEIAHRAQVFAVAIDPTSLNLFPGSPNRIAAGLEALPRPDLERAAIQQLLQDQPLWGLEGEQESFAHLFYELKEGVAGNHAGEVLASQIAASALVEKVRLANKNKAEVAR